MRTMFCEAIGIMINRTMELHDFQIDGTIYRQKEGGAIGMDLTGVVSDVYMCEWDKGVMAKMREENLEPIMYKRYKDDVNIVVEDRGDVECTSQEIMQRVKVAAESVDENLKVTTDCTGEHENGKVPILDLNVWIGEDEEGKRKVLYDHYMKGVASRSTIHFRSSHSTEMKKNVAVNELTRILRNCSSDIPWSETADHLSYYIQRMQFSGYPEEFRQEVLEQTMKRHDRAISRRMNETTRNNEPVQRGTTTEPDQWYAKDGKSESVIFVEATPGSELAKRIRTLMKRLDFNIKVVEKAGATIKGTLQRSNPFGVNHCGRMNCTICEGGNSTNCRTRGCVYEYVCGECERKYCGQTGRTIYERNREHMDAWDNGFDECPLQRHSNLFHNGERFDVEVKVVAKCYGRPTRRMVTEAVLIGEIPDDQTMNNRSEWNYANLTKMTVNG